MGLADYVRDMEGCSRCSACKWVPFNQIKSHRFSKNCPAIYRYNLHAYSGAGRLTMALSMLQDRSELNEEIIDIVYHCQLCGACDVSCKAYRDDIDVFDTLLELRRYCADSGRMPSPMSKYVPGDAGESAGADRGEWAEGLKVKDASTQQVEVLYHAGCRYSYDPDLRDTALAQVALLFCAGVDVGVLGLDESCCGALAYSLGYTGEAAALAGRILEGVKASGARTLVTGCSDGYGAFNYLYGKMGVDLGVEVLHVTEHIERLIREKRLEMKKEVPLLVTYHDPCHLGRMSEPYTGEWSGDKLERPISLKRSGRNGVYDAPRKVLESIPGVRLVEMERIREYAWCCGAGGGMLENHPGYAAATAGERIQEALSTGAEALVTACPRCERLFRDTVREMEVELPVFDVADLVMKSVAVTEPASG